MLLVRSFRTDFRNLRRFHFRHYLRSMFSRQGWPSSNGPRRLTQTVRGSWIFKGFIELRVSNRHEKVPVSKLRVQKDVIDTHDLSEREPVRLAFLEEGIDTLRRCPFPYAG